MSDKSLMEQAVAGLPAIPVIPVDLTGFGLSPHCLPEAGVFTRGIRRYLDEHAPEVLTLHCTFYKRVLPDHKASIHFVLSTADRSLDRVVAKTINDDDAIKIVIGNTWRGRWMSCIRWELFEDPELIELCDMGRFDQFSFLQDVDPDKWGWLKSRRIVPRGDWDFDRMLWPITCNNCGNPVAVNNHIMSIDHAICGVCGNRPWLARSIGHDLENMLGSVEEQGLMSQKFINAQHLHLLDWITRSGATFDQVRLSNESDLPISGLAVVRMFDEFAKNIMSHLSPSEMEQCNLMMTQARKCLLGQTDKSSALDKANRGAVIGLIDFLKTKIR